VQLSPNIVKKYKTRSVKNQSPIFLLKDTDLIERDASNNSIVAFIFVAAVTFFIEPLPSNDRGIHI
jgi:hypothetical protein